MITLTENDLKKQVPSIFSTESHAGTSSKYSLIPTIDCVRGLQQAGFIPVQAKESRCRNSENQPYSRHSIRFRRENWRDGMDFGDLIPEIVLVNSHDAKSSYHLRAGVYRTVCSNGLIVGEDYFHRSIKHMGDVIPKVVQSAGEIIDIIPEVVETAKNWSKIPMNQEQKLAYTISAALIKWDEDKIPFSPYKLADPRRHYDTNSDLWSIFNVVQEKMIKGGVKYYDPLQHRKGTSRGINSVSENVRVNVALWNLTKKTAQSIG